MLQFPARLKKARELRGKKQRELAEQLGIRLRSYQAYENGEREPSFDKLVVIADYLDVTTDYLLGRIDDDTEQ